MADDDKGGEAAPVETNALQAPRDFEAEARDMGWTPEAEWKGDKKPVKFLSAEEYVERGETLIPILNKRLKEKDAEFAERLKKIESLNSKTVERLQKQFEKDLAEAQAAKKAAVKAGNVEEVERLDAEIDELKADAPKADKKLTGAALEKHNQKVQEDWTGAHDWWGVDEDMTAWAIGKSQAFAAKDPDISIEDNLSKLDEALKKKYPEKFGGEVATKPSANGHALVDSGGDFPGGKGSDPLKGLPSEARAQAKADMQKYPKIYPDATTWRETYEGKR